MFEDVFTFSFATHLLNAAFSLELSELLVLNFTSTFNSAETWGRKRKWLDDMGVVVSHGWKGNLKQTDSVRTTQWTRRVQLLCSC